MRNRIHKLLFYTFILSVYGVFFSVESFYNFEGQLNTKALLQYASQAHSTFAKQATLRTTPLSSSSSHNVRLNKRFHQSDIETCPIVVVEAPVSRVIPRILGTYRPAPIQSITLLPYPSRGPPVVA